ncbi:MAG: hypothetical protein IKQ56_05000 [Lachnospiraceae bacterium]|nr:hypothetical protein [Lachnospiraceae bacterium]MCR4946374.1 hypothetical protein [Lachnospiraceae bacterium]
MEKADKINALVEKINSHLTAGGSGEFLTREDYEFILGSLEAWEDAKREIQMRSQNRAYSEYQFGENHGYEEAVDIIDKYLIGENTLKLGNSSITWTEEGQNKETVSFY